MSNIDILNVPYLNILCISSKKQYSTTAQPVCWWQCLDVPTFCSLTTTQWSLGWETRPSSGALIQTRCLCSPVQVDSGLALSRSTAAQVARVCPVLVFWLFIYLTTTSFDQQNVRKSASLRSYFRKYRMSPLFPCPISHAENRHVFRMGDNDDRK